MEKTITNTITKAKVKDQQLEVTYEEFIPDDNYTNTINKKCTQIVHKDLTDAFDKLKPHIACICEMPEADRIREAGFYDFDESILDKYVVTGYTHGGSDESAGVTIIGQKLLQSGKVLNIVTPFIQFADEDAYRYAGELCADVEACDYEVEQYLFNEKWGIKQLDFDFDTPDDVSITVTTGIVDEEKPKKRGKKKVAIESEVLVETA